MRICLYTNTALPCIGGQEHVVDALARGYQAAGHDVVVLAPSPPHGLRAHDAELPYPVVRHRRFVSTRWFVDWYLPALTKLQRRFECDLVHCHNIYPSGYLAGLYKRRGGPPVVLTSHGGDVRTDNPRYRKPGVRDRHCFAVRQADRIVSISSFTDQGFRALGAQPQQLVTLPNGVDTKQLRHPVERPGTVPAQLSSGEYLLYVGRLVPLKGVDVLLRAVALWAATGAEVPHVVLAGDGTERPALEALRSKLNLQTTVSFVGYVRGAEKTWLLQNAFALVVPSREREAFPLVLLEGFAAGCAVVASDALGLRDLVEPGRTGWMVPRNDPNALARQLQQLWQHPAALLPIRQHVRHYAEACDWQHVIARHLDLYQQVLAEAAQSRQAA